MLNDGKNHFNPGNLQEHRTFFLLTPIAKKNYDVRIQSKKQPIICIDKRQHLCCIILRSIWRTNAVCAISTFYFGLLVSWTLVSTQAEILEEYITFEIVITYNSTGGCPYACYCRVLYIQHLLFVLNRKILLIIIASLAACRIIRYCPSTSTSTSTRFRAK